MTVTFTPRFTSSLRKGLPRVWLTVTCPKCRHHDRVPRIVELKLVNAHEFAIRELINSIAKAKKSNHVGVFNESAK